MNLEDAAHHEERTLVDLPLQLEKIAAVKETAHTSGVPIVLNARTDIYLLEIGKPESRYDAALERMSEFRDAGADCLFAPGLRDAETIRRLVSELRCPVNILAGPESPSITRVAETGCGAGKSRLVSHTGHAGIAAENGPGIEDHRNLPIAGRRAFARRRESIVELRHRLPPPAAMYH
jgi:2-methylisocitrate lyase-like PEP mutase family enzyme